MPAPIEAFEQRTVRLAIVQIVCHRPVDTRTRNSRKYMQIENSIKSVGMVEPLIVSREKDGSFSLVDGRIRLEIVKDRGATDVECLISTDDEAYTYNKRVCRLSIIQEHNMLLRALERGVAEERLQDSLSIASSTLRQKRNLLRGICEEVVELLKDRHVATNLFTVLRKMVPTRQIEAVQLMIAVNKFSVAYANSLLAASTPADLRETAKDKGLKGLKPQQIAMMERESANLEREHRAAQRSFAQRNLNLVIARGYVSKLLQNAEVFRYLSKHHIELLAGLQNGCSTESSQSVTRS